MNYKKLVVNLLLAIVLAFLLCLAINAVVPDTAWCIDNYPLERIPHCLHFENSVYGKFIQPSGF